MYRYFSRREAEDLLPELIPVLESLQYEVIELELAQVRLIELRRRSFGNGHRVGESTGEIQSSIDRIERDIEALSNSITGKGVLLKDAAVGLIDFPTVRDGQPVLLCWKLGETGVTWWHTSKAGLPAVSVWTAERRAASERHATVTGWHSEPQETTVCQSRAHHRNGEIHC